MQLPLNLPALVHQLCTYLVHARPVKRSAALLQTLPADVGGGSANLDLQTAKSCPPV